MKKGILAKMMANLSEAYDNGGVVYDTTIGVSKVEHESPKMTGFTKVNGRKHMSRKQRKQKGGRA